jgi:hypothetical protein
MMVTGVRRKGVKSYRAACGCRVQVHDATAATVVRVCSYGDALSHPAVYQAHKERAVESVLSQLRDIS